MRAARPIRRPLCAGLTALLLLVFAAPEALVLCFAEAGHSHDHGAAHGAGGWVQRTSDHAPHDASQLEATTPVRHDECALCTGRVRPHESVLGLAEALTHRDASSPLQLAVRPAAATGESSPRQPRAPPLV